MEMNSFAFAVKGIFIFFHGAFITASQFSVLTWRDHPVHLFSNVSSQAGRKGARGAAIVSL